MFTLYFGTASHYLIGYKPRPPSLPPPCPAQSALTPTTGADCQLYNDYAINPIGVGIVSLKCLWNHILFSRIIVHKQ